MTSRISHLASRLQAFGLLLFLGGCATVQDDWNVASRYGTIHAYEKFIHDHPTAPQASFAKTRITDLRAGAEWNRTVAANTIENYSDFINQYPQAKQTEQARKTLNQLETKRDWGKIKASPSIAGYEAFEPYKLSMGQRDRTATLTR